MSFAIRWFLTQGLPFCRNKNYVSKQIYSLLFFVQCLHKVIRSSRSDCVRRPEYHLSFGEFANVFVRALVFWLRVNISA